MIKVIVKKDFTSNIGNYIVGDEITNLTYEQIVKLNEQGLIEPLDFKQLTLLQRELENKKGGVTYGINS